MTRPGFMAAVAAEWVKARTIRSTRATLVAALAGLPVLALFVGATGSLQPDDTVMGGGLTGAPLTQVLLGAFGVLLVSTEYASGTLAVTLAACPRRATVLAAKAVVVVAVVFPASLVAAAAAFGVGEVTLSGHARGEPWPALVGVAACLAVSALAGLALGTALRSTAGGVAAVVGVTLVPTMFGPLFGDYERWVAGASPTSTLEKLTQTSDAATDVVGSLGPWPSLAALAGATAAVLALAAARFTRRDA